MHFFSSQLRSIKKVNQSLVNGLILFVIPAKAGIQTFSSSKKRIWIPAFAGMTEKGMHTHYSPNSNHGFTLMELIVSVAVFSIILLAAVDVMISVFSAQAKAIALKDVLDNARFSVELMSRELRTGSNIVYTTVPPPNCPRPGLQFTSYNQGSPQERFYYWEDTDGDSVRDALMRVAMTTAGSVDCSIVVPQQFTSEEIIVDQWTVRLLGNLVGLGERDGQPRITFGFVMHSRDPRIGPNTFMRLQTTITQRLRDFL